MSQQGADDNVERMKIGKGRREQREKKGRGESGERKEGRG
jgi:hypothetical protein